MTVDLRLPDCSMRGPAGATITLHADTPDDPIVFRLGGTLTDIDDTTDTTAVNGTNNAGTTTWVIPVPEAAASTPIRITVAGTVAAVGRLFGSERGTGAIDETLTVNLTTNDITFTLLGGGGAVASVNGETGTVVLDAADVGAASTAALASEAALARNADNLTSGTVADARLPAGLARDSEVTTLLAGKADLDGGGKVPASQLPAYVDDVVEHANQAAFPATGTTGLIYVALDTNRTYRWSGSAYVEISASLALGETSASAYRGDRGKTAYDHSQATGNPHGTTAEEIVGLGERGWGPADMVRVDPDVITPVVVAGGRITKHVYVTQPRVDGGDRAPFVELPPAGDHEGESIVVLAATGAASATVAEVDSTPAPAVLDYTAWSEWILTGGWVPSDDVDLVWDYNGTTVPAPVVLAELGGGYPDLLAAVFGPLVTAGAIHDDGALTITSGSPGATSTIELVDDDGSGFADYMNDDLTAGYDGTITGVDSFSGVLGASEWYPGHRIISTTGTHNHPDAADPIQRGVRLWAVPAALNGGTAKWSAQNWPPRTDMLIYRSDIGMAKAQHALDALHLPDDLVEGTFGLEVDVVLVSGTPELNPGDPGYEPPLWSITYTRTEHSPSSLAARLAALEAVVTDAVGPPTVLTLKSPDGTEWTASLDDAGMLDTEEV